MSEPPKHDLGFRIGAHFRLPGLEAASTVHATAHFPLGNSLIIPKTTYYIVFDNTVHDVCFACAAPELVIPQSHDICHTQ